MKIEAWYFNNFEARLAGRYITIDHISPLLDFYKNDFEISIIGASELGKNISLVKIGSGKKKVFAWSQMHGNESTTTKAIFDLLKFLKQKEVFQDEIRDFLNNNTLYVIPILNPDGATLYTRENANSIDLNRDAINLSQNESKILKNAFLSITPDLCLNLHGQRTIFGLNNALVASISFLSPASNKKRELTPSRKKAMKLIVKMDAVLQKYIPGQIGRYDDSFNSNCFGDSFQMENVPVILFEAGHYKFDYQREKTREYIFYSLLTLFEFIRTDEVDDNDYFNIPENKKNYKDIILRDIRLKEEEDPFSIAIQYVEVLNNGIINFIPKIDSVGSLEGVYGHLEIPGNNEIILVNSQNKVTIEDEITTINNKNGDSLIYISKNGLINKYN